MAERQSPAGAEGYKRLCDVIVLAPIVHVDGNDRERYSVICTETRGFLGASALIILSINPLPTIGNSLKKQKSLYKVLTPSIKP